MCRLCRLHGLELDFGVSTTSIASKPIIAVLFSLAATGVASVSDTIQVELRKVENRVDAGRHAPGRLRERAQAEKKMWLMVPEGRIYVAVP